MTVREARRAIITILDRHPGELEYFGTPGEGHEGESVIVMLLPSAIDEFRRAVRWLWGAVLPSNEDARGKTCTIDSYALKHLGEAVAVRHYLAGGVVTAAALHVGLYAKPSADDADPNWEIRVPRLWLRGQRALAHAIEARSENRRP